MSTKIYDKNRLVITRYCMHKGMAGYEFHIHDPYTSISQNLTPLEVKEIIAILKKSLKDMGD